jgi:LysR family cys regulon transcriptional activator
VGIIASMGYEPERDRDLAALDASHLFEPSITKIGIRKDAYLRGFAYTFIELFAPHLTRAKVDEAILAGQQP